MCQDDLQTVYLCHKLFLISCTILDLVLKASSPVKVKHTV